MRPMTPTRPRQPAARAATTTAAVVALMAGLLAGTAVAQTGEEVIMFQDRVPEATELADILFPTVDAAPPVRTRGLAPSSGTRTRGLRPLDWGEQVAQEEKAAATAAAAAAAEREGPAGFGFNIHFAFDSTEVLPESQPYLDKVGEMLNMEQSRGRAIVIAGHTDATGPASYNWWLSEQRAAAVARYLEEQHGIDSERLRIAPFGEEQPLPATDPNDWTNRRVEFRAAP